MNVLITGGDGYIGSSMAKSFRNKYAITSITRKNFDFADSRATNSWFDDHSYDVVIHTAISGGSRLVNDSADTLDNNLRMHYNLLSNKHKFGRLITFGSGAEIYGSNTPYGLSKKIIADTIRRTDNWYNLRIFGVFDENELDTRFIKANLIRYINKKPMLIHTNKIMDFFYMPDLISMVDCYINDNSLPKEINCSYDSKKSLLEIASFINELGEEKVEIFLQSEEFQLYYGKNDGPLPIQEIGLMEGIRRVFRELRLKTEAL